MYVYSFFSYLKCSQILCDHFTFNRKGFKKNRGTSLTFGMEVTGKIGKKVDSLQGILEPSERRYRSLYILLSEESFWENSYCV